MCKGDVDTCAYDVLEGCEWHSFDDEAPGSVIRVVLVDCNFHHRHYFRV